MSSKKFVGFDLVGFAVFFVGIFLIVCLGSYHSTDAVREPVFPFNRIYVPDIVQHPASSELGNVCGPVGAMTADVMLRVWGGGAYVVAGSLLALSVVMVVGGPVQGPCIRLAGWFLMLICVTTLLSLAVTRNWTGPVIGPGGYVGALGHGLLVEWTGPIGCALIAAAGAICGILLCTGSLPIRIAAMTASAAINKANRRRSSRAATAAEGGGLSVMIGGKRSTRPLDDEDVPADDAEEYEDEYEEEEDAGAEYEDEELEDEYEDDEAADDEAETTVAASAARGLRGLLRRATPSSLRSDTESDEQEPETDSEPEPPKQSESEARFVKPSDKKAANAERMEVMEQLDEASRREDPREYDLPPIDLLVKGDTFSYDDQEKEVRRKAKILEKTFSNFNLNVKVVEIETGPVIAQYEIELEPGLRLSKITGLADDLAIALRVPSVRIVAPIPGKNTVGIEVPNEQRQVVRLRDVIEEVNSRGKNMRIPLYLGKDVSGNPLVADLSTLPHLLIAGRTGTGKSVCLNAIISSILMTRRPDEVRMLMIDPKMVELSGYKTLPHLMHPVVTDMRKAEAILAWAVDKMEERYSLLAQAGVRHVSAYNQLGEEELMERMQLEEGQSQDVPTHLPFIVIVADEMADLMMTAGKEVEQHIIRLAQKSRAVGIHLILATQKPTVDVITGLIKSNLPARIAFQVASRTDSRVVLDEMGADKLLGNGDMLFLWPGTSTLLRGQGTFLTDDEINAVVECVSTGEQDFVKELVQLKVEDGDESAVGAQLKKRDDLYESAVDIVVREGRGSVSLLQRCLGIGYGRAARLIDFMAEDGIVGPYNGSQAREITISVAEWEAMQAGETAPPEPAPAAEPAAAKSRRTHKIVRDEDWTDDDANDSQPSTPPGKVAPVSVPPDDANETSEENAEDEEYEEEYEEEVDEYEDEDEAFDGDEYDDPDAEAEDEEYESEEEDEAYDEDEYEVDEEQYEPEQA